MYITKINKLQEVYYGASNAKILRNFGAFEWCDNFNLRCDNVIVVPLFREYDEYNQNELTDIIIYMICCSCLFP